MIMQMSKEVSNRLRSSLLIVIVIALALAWPSAPAATGAGPSPTNATLTLVGSLALPPTFPSFVTTYNNLAIVGNFDVGDTYLIDVSDATQPRVIGTVKGHPDSAASFPHVMRIGGRDVLANNYQGETHGLELVDITDPSHPRVLSFYDVGGGGVHEMDLTQTPSGRALALLAVPNRELRGSRIDGKRIGDLMIVDITDPTKPVLAGEWGVIDQFGMAFFETAHRGWNPSVFGHSVWAYPGGTRVLLAYKDAGVFILDIRDPRNPVLVGRTEFPDGAEGEASFAVRQGNILIQGDEDYFTFRTTFRGKNSRAWSAVEPRFTKTVYSLPGHKFFGELVHVGRGCLGESYPAGVPGKIALIERSGACRFDQQIGRAQLEGAVAVVVYNADASSGLPNAGDNAFPMSGSRNVTVPDANGRLVTVSISIPVVGISRSASVLPDGKMLSYATVTARVDGWGFLRFFRIDNPQRLSPIGTFLPEHLTVARLLASRVALASAVDSHNVHNPIARDNKIYAPWRDDGLRVIDISAKPREVVSWTGQGAPAGAKGAVWSVAFYKNFILAVDPDFGLYILRENP